MKLKDTKWITGPLFRVPVLFAILMFVASEGWGQQNFYWTFNQSSTNCALNVMNQTPNATNIAGSFTYDNICTTTGGIATTGNAFVSVGATGNALRNTQVESGSKTYTFQLSGSDLVYMSNFKVYFQFRRNSTANSPQLNVSYSTNGTAFTSFSDLFPDFPTANTWVDYLVDMSSVSALNGKNLSGLWIRITYSQTGTTTIVDIDNFQIQGLAELSGATITETFSTSGTFTVPNCVTSLIVEAWGGGGGGGRSTSTNTGRGGGGGGAYARSVLNSVVPGTPYGITIGQGGTGGDLSAFDNSGSSTIFGSNVVVAAGGGGVANNDNAGGSGGNENNCTGDVKRSGGSGANGSGGNAGGGGGGAGSNQAGGNASGTTAGTGGNELGGNGGAGRTDAGSGNPGNNYGGGGGGGRRGGFFSSSQNGGTGAPGFIRITYTLPNAPTITLGSNPSVPVGTTTANLAYTATTGCPDKYSIDWDGTAQGQGFTDVTGATLGASPIVLAVPGGANPATYDGTFTVTNSSYGFVSSTYNIQVTITGGGSTITTSAITGSTFCAGAAVSVPYTITGTFISGNVFTAQLSDASGSFTSPVSIGTLTSSAAGTINATIPSGTTSGTAYRIRVVSDNPAVTGSDNGTNLTINALPTFNTSNYLDISCFGGSDGSIQVNITGGVDNSPYTFSINNGMDYSAVFTGSYPTYTITGLTAATHKIRIKDKNGCESAVCP